MIDTFNQSATLLTSAEQITRLTDFFNENVQQILEFVSYTILAGFAITTIAIFIIFGIFKALSIFRDMSSL